MRNTLLLFALSLSSITGFSYAPEGCFSEGENKYESLVLSTSVIKITDPISTTVTFDLATTTVWTITTSESWLVPDVDNGTGNATITLTIHENTSEYSRECFVTVEAGLEEKSIHITQNGVSFWQDANSGLSGSYAIAAKDFVTDSRTGYLFAGTVSNLFRSKDAGNSWESIIIPQMQGVYSLAVSGNRIYCGTYNGLFFSEDNGETWMPTYNGFASNANHIMDIEVTVNGIYAATSAGVYFSSDDGYTWTPRNNGLLTLYSNVVLIESTKMYTGTIAGIFMSENGGLSWVAINNGLTGNALNIKTIWKKDNRLFIGTAGSKIYYSDDNGSTWTQSGTGITGSDINSINNLGNTLIAAGLGIFISQDNGGSWNKVSEILGYKILNIENQLFACTEWGVFSSTDGTTWEQVTNEMSVLEINTLNEKDDVLFVGTNRSGVFVSNDDGDSWSQKNNGLSSTCVFSFVNYGEKIYAGCYGGVNISEDYGENWTVSGIGDVFALAEAAEKFLPVQQTGFFARMMRSSAGSR